MKGISGARIYHEWQHGNKSGHTAQSMTILKKVTNDNKKLEVYHSLDKKLPIMP
jgi:hypothetical protein